MKITRLSVYQVDLPFSGRTYKLSGGRTRQAVDSTIIRIDTDSGLVGWGETCPFGANYLEAFGLGARAGIAELAPLLLGQDPSQPSVIYRLMEHNLSGHVYVKHGIDMICWDIFGKLAEKPLYSLFGGKLNEKVPTAGGIPLQHDESMDQRISELRANGCAQFSSKASGEISRDMEFLNTLGDKMRAGESVKFDANGGWTVDQAIRLMRGTTNVDAYFEQPCRTYEECRAVRLTRGRPMVLDECALDLPSVNHAWNDGVCDALNLKIARVGGLTPALEIRNLCVALGIPVHIQCAGGSSITQAAIVHLAQSTPADRLLYIWDIGDLVSLETVQNPVLPVSGTMCAHNVPGLGVEPKEQILSESVMVFE